MLVVGLWGEEKGAARGPRLKNVFNSRVGLSVSEVHILNLFLCVNFIDLYT